MDFTTALFYAFAAVLLLSALQVITARNPVQAALFLVLAFFTAAGIWLLLKAEFLAIVLVLVYVGAVMVLFLFVVMMLDINLDKLREGFWSHFPLAATVGVVIVLEMSAVLWRGFSRSDSNVPFNSDYLGTTKALGIELYTQYILAFEVAAVILLLAMVAAVTLTLRKRKDTKYVNPADAVKVKSKDRVRIIKMTAESDRAKAAAAASATQNTEV
jgi:NADH-quinone oxidoreductase subunit J